MEIPDSLPAQLFLLAYDSKKQRLVSWSELGYALRAAALADLLLSGYLVDDGGKAVPGGHVRGLDPVLETVLLEIADARPRSWQHWVSRRSSAMVTAVREQLAAARVIKVESRRVLWLFPVHRITLRQPYEVKRLAEEVRRAVRGGQPISRVAPRLGALSALAGTAELRTVFTRSERRQHKERLTTLGGPVKPTVKALRKVIQAQRSALAG